MKKRKIDIAVVSDIHLGTKGCHAQELLVYLSSIQPGILVLNGDILDVWQFKKNYFPPSHLKVIKKIINMAANGTRVVYITGNHDEMLRKFAGTAIGNFSIRNKLVLELDGKKAWFFHGDVFDVSIRHSRWFARMGHTGYSLLIALNRLFNWFLQKMGRERYSLSRRINNSAQQGVEYQKKFESTSAGLAIDSGFDYVICGHIHKPNKKLFENKNGQCTYLNSGDWLECLTALEYSFKRWKIYTFSHDKLAPFFGDEDLKEIDVNELLGSILDLKVKSVRQSENKSTGE